ncbi:hypothetical protein [Streptomyces ossamyceticus]|uniref:hypothetical protein n=1 Tax=Streptomyces ossamyceticus TaxID=249581 RepID=UPI000AA261E6|nr:hypothetical protein [Streptomyces ossamyceticus]
MNVHSNVLGGLPVNLREELIGALANITRNFSEGRWEPSELNGGKLCEIVYSIIRGHADGQFPQRPYKPNNMVRECQKLEQETQLPRSLRIQVPRILIALYEIRNNRGVGHAGSDVDPNHMDAVAVLYMSKWIVAELIRVFHDVDTATASEAVDALVERQLEVVWSVDGKKRVLSEKLSLHDKTLLLLYSESSPVAEKDLLSWTEAANASSYRRDILKKCHKARLIEYDDVGRIVRLSPKGARYVEENIPLTVP